MLSCPPGRLRAGDPSASALVTKIAPHSAGNAPYFDMPRIDLSPSGIRERVAEGAPIRYLVPEPVEAEIAARGYYRAVHGSPAR